MIFYILMGILAFIILISLIGYFMKRRSYKNLYKRLEVDKNLDEYARFLLDTNNLADVKVEIVGFWKGLFIGSTYSINKKTIYLSKYLVRRPTVNNLTTICSLVGIAKMDLDNEKGLKTIQLNRFINWLPILLFPMMFIGLIIDATVTWQNIALEFTPACFIYTSIFSGIGLLLSLFAVIVSFTSAKKRKKANIIGKDLMIQLDILNEDETKRLDKLVKSMNRLVYLQVFIDTLYLLFFSIDLVFKLVGLLNNK